MLKSLIVFKVYMVSKVLKMLKMAMTDKAMTALALEKLSAR